MTETELTDRLREAIVLDGPDVWRANGYLEDARQAGLSEADAQKRAAAISQEVANNNLLFQNIQARIARLAQPSRIHLYDQDLNQIVNAASSLKLSPDFVRHRWVPTVLKRLGGEPKTQQPQPVVEPAVVTPPVIAEPVTKSTSNDVIERKPETPKPIVVTPSEPVPPSTPPIEPPIYVSPTPVAPVERPVKPPSPPEPAPVVRSFTATPARVSKGQPVTLAWEVDNLLAVTIDDLGEGLSPANRGWVKPTKTTEYTLFDANNNPLSTVRVEVIKPDRSGLYGVLFALALLAAIYWLIRSNNKSDANATVDRKAEQTTSASDERLASSRKKKVRREKRQPKTETNEAASSPAKPSTEPVATRSEPTKKADSPISKPISEDKTASVKPAPKPATPADARQGKYEEAFGDKPYDKIELGADERGWRRARNNGRWGYVNEKDEWVIQPEFEAVTPFRGNTAAVFLNGQLMTINRLGEPVKK